MCHFYYKIAVFFADNRKRFLLSHSPRTICFIYTSHIGQLPEDFLGNNYHFLTKCFPLYPHFSRDFFDSYCKSLQKRLGIIINAIVQGHRERGELPFPWYYSFRLQPPPPRNDSLATILQSIVEDQHEYTFHSRSGDKQPFNILDKKVDHFKLTKVNFK